MMRYLVLFAVCLFWTASVQAQTRHAFVVGIDTYDNVASLAKARNDARSVAGALEEAGFRTQLLIDADETALLTELTRFSGQLNPGDEVVFYFAGHGVEINGRNYLLPADVPSVAPGQELVVTRGALPVSEVIDQFNARGVRLSVLILDACRDNPFETLGTRSLGRSVGLGREDAPEGTFVMFSAGAGQQALDRLSTDDPNPNSVFTRVLLPRLTEPGLPLRTMVREVRSEVRALGRSVAHEQFPAVYDQLDGAFTFVPAVATPDPVVNAPVAPPDIAPVATDPCTAARADWQLIGETPSVTLLEAYRAAHSGCPLMATLASERLAALSDGPSVTPPVVTPTPAPPTVTPPTPISTVTTPTLIPTPTPTPQGDGSDTAQLVQACLDAVHPDMLPWRDLQSTSVQDQVELPCLAALQALPDPSSAEHAEVTTLLGRVEHARGNFDAAFSLYQAAANAGDPLGASNLGYLYQHGQGVEPDGELAGRWYRRSGELGRAEGWYNYGMIYFRGRVVERDNANALLGMTQAAELGHVRAMERLGFMYRDGNGVAEDDTTAAEWFRRGAEAGNVRSMTNLGFAYQMGRGIDRNFDAAFHWYRQAMAAGSTDAMARLGEMYRNGSGRGREPERAYPLLLQAAEEGSTFAMRNLVPMYQIGDGVQIDQSQAARWVLQSLLAGDDFFIRNPSGLQVHARREVQIQLRDAGYFSGATDGVAGPGTITAMQAFYDANN